jgi:hypothetical protein
MAHCRERLILDDDRRIEAFALPGHFIGNPFHIGPDLGVINAGFLSEVPKHGHAIRR